MDEKKKYSNPPWDEMLNGEIVLMPSRPANHNKVVGNIRLELCSQMEILREWGVVGGADVFLSEKNRLVPDIVVFRKAFLKGFSIYGVPDLVVEVLSPGSRNRDRGCKKDLYEKFGVTEYWIVEPEAQIVEVYLLKNGRFRLDDVYEMIPSDWGLPAEHEIGLFKSEVPASVFKGISVPLEVIFRNTIE